MLPSLLQSLLIPVALVFYSDACMRVTPGNPGIPATCQQCDPTLITKTLTGAGAIEFESDTTAIVNGCSVRTLVCTGNMATIEVNAPNGGTLTDEGAGTISISPVCNAAGTAWVLMGIDIMTLECSAAAPAAACQNCMQNLIMITQLGAGAKAFESDTTTIVNGCAQRTVVCMGTSANIEFNNMEGVIQDTDPGQVAGMVTLVLTCNAAGDGWVIEGITLTQMECSAAD